MFAPERDSEFSLSDAQEFFKRHFDSKTMQQIVDRIVDNGHFSKLYQMINIKAKDVKQMMQHESKNFFMGSKGRPDFYKQKREYLKKA